MVYIASIRQITQGNNKSQLGMCTCHEYFTKKLNEA